MRNKIYLFLLCFTGCFVSCDSFLDLQPKGIVIPRYYEDYEKLINYAQLLKASDSYPNFMTDDVYLPDDGNVNFNDLIGICTRSKRRYSGMQKQMVCGNIRTTGFIIITRLSRG